jgi:hypothetical protein
MDEDVRDVFGIAAAWRADPAIPKRLFGGMPEGQIPIYCPVCDQRWAIPRSRDRRFPRDLAILIYSCDACSGRDGPGEVDQLWLDAEGYPVVPDPSLQ